jgi:hypothetical protein
MFRTETSQRSYEGDVFPFTSTLGMYNLDVEKSKSNECLTYATLHANALTKGTPFTLILGMYVAIEKFKSNFYAMLSLAAVTTTTSSAPTT